MPKPPIPPLPQRLPEAMIDAQGNVYGVGSLRITPATAIAFVDTPSEFVQLTVHGTDSLGLATCSVRREPRTGYLDPGAVLHRVSLPTELSVLLYRALSRLDHSPLTFALDKDGQLESDGGEARSAQGLSDWRGSVKAVDDVIVVSITAALRSLTPLPFFATRDDVPLRDGEVVPRLEIELSLDPVTRALRFGSYTKTLERGHSRDLAPTHRTSLVHMRLETTSIGTLGAMYGIAEDGGWVRFFEGRDSGRIAISGPSSRLYRVHRDDHGFLAHANLWPRIWLNGVDLDTIVSAMRMTPRFGMRMTVGSIGSIEWGGGAEPPPYGEILAADLEFELTAEGLVLRYSILYRRPEIDLLFPARPPEEKLLHGSFTLPWEVLIIRAPALLEHRDSAAGPDGKLGGGLSPR